MLELWFDQDLNEPVSVRTVSGNIFHQDAGGNKIGVRVTKDGASYALSSGTVTGYVIRADGTTITISGTRSGNTAYIILPATACSVKGPIQIVIKLTQGSEIVTLAAMQSSVLAA